MASTTDETAASSMNTEQEEEDSCWVPLIEEEPTVQSSSQQQAAQTNAMPPPDSTPPRRESLQVISARLDSKIRLKKGLVDHPLDQGWRLFLQHFCREIWQLDVHLQLGIVLVVIGIAMLSFTWALSFRWFHPQTIILFIVFGVSFYYLAPPDVERKIQSFFRLLLNPDKAFELADYADPAVMRRLFLFLLLIPTFLEMRTFGFLSEAMAESGFMSNVSVGVILSAFLAYRFKIQQATPRQCIQRGIHVLYGFALVFSLYRVDLRRLPALLGPFCLATGTLLLSSRDEDMNWLSRALRHALRLTLRDVLASVGESVREDEMLQLAMLRWIVDYWSYQPPATPAATSAPNQAASSTESRPSSTDIVPSQNTRPQEAQQHHDLQWDELQPMLDMTTDQMIEEVPGHPVGSVSNVSSASPPPSASRPSQSYADSSQQDNDSLHNLRNMLHALDVDDRARPAVMKYKHVVESFPPPRNLAVFLSIIRRCPAMLMLLYRYVSGSDLALASTATLLPFAIMEAFRVLHWAEACQRALESGVRSPHSEEVSSDQSRSLISLPPDMDPMCILLSGDLWTPTFPPPLLQVWINICSSVYALETGLTAARCVQTTAVAADFASNIISLAQFGVEVTQFGWIHGITILARELMHIHATQSAGEAKYTSAAVNAVRNGSIVARNVKALSEEEDGNPVIDAIGGVLAGIVGRGWLWGKEEEQRQESTVTIEELPSDETQSDRKVPKLLTKEPSVTEEVADRDEHGEATVDTAGGGPAAVEAKAAEDSGVSTIAPEKDELQPSNEMKPMANVSTGVPLASTEGSRAGKETPVAPVAQLVEEDEAPAQEPKLLPCGSSSEPPQAGTSGAETQQDLSELMQLIADAFEQGLIVESEKNAFMETLLVSGTEDRKKSTRATIEQMERSLRELLESSRSEAVSCDERQESEPSPATIQPEEGDAGEPTATLQKVDSSQSEPADDSDEWRPLRPQSPRELMQETGNEQGSSSVAAVRTTGLDVTRASENSIGTPDLQASTSGNVSSSGEQQEGKGDEWVKWVGGSLAVIGAVAGGIALANNTSQGQDDNSSRQNTTNQSTVFIEELDDDNDENTDEWVAVSSSNNAD